MPRDLKADMETLRKVLDLVQNRDFLRAGTLAEETLASGFEHPMLLNVLATRFEQQGRFPEALRLLERAVAISPTDVGARNALALCLQRLDRPAEALIQVEHLLKDNPELGFAHANRGNALIALGLLAAAKVSFLRALELDPGNLAATAALASIATHRGEHRDARRWADQALAAAPGYPDAILSLAAADLAEGDTAHAANRLHGLIMDSRAGQLDRARAAGLLGDVLDAEGRFAAAFDSYTACNEVLRDVYVRLASGTSTLTYAGALSAALQRTASDRWNLVQRAAAPPHAGVLDHVFLLGFPRSGTTLLEVALDGHPNVVSAEELELLTDGVLEFMREPVDFERLLRAQQPELEALRTAYWNRVRAADIDAAGKVFVDKHPLNTLKLPLIACLFPRAKILFACRDPRDVVLSCFRRRFNMNRAMYELLTLSGAAGFYAAVMEFAGRFQAAVELNWREVRYESLVGDFGGEMRAICHFLGLEWSSGMENFAERVRIREHATPSTAQLSRGLNSSSIAHWQCYGAQLQPVLPILMPWIQRFGGAEGLAIAPDGRGTSGSRG